MARPDLEFSSPGPNRVVSRRGFSVEVIGQTSVRYREDPCTIDIFSEVVGGNRPSIIIRRTDILTGDRSGSKADILRSRIEKNIQRAFAFKRWSLLVE